MALTIPLKIRHPSWRIFTALTASNIPVGTYGLKEGIEVHKPSLTNDDLTATLLLVLDDPDFIDGSYSINDCLELFADIEGRQAVEGLLLFGRSVTEVAAITGCDENVIATYACLFYDVTVFPTSAHRMTYVRRGTAGADSLAKNFILDKGIDAFLAKQGGLYTPSLNMEELLKQAAVLAYTKMSTKAEDDDLDVQGIALGWANSFTKMVGQLGKNKQKGVSLKDLVITLQTDPKESIPSFEDLKNM